MPNEDNSAAWQAAGQAISSAASAIGTSNLNKKNRKYADEVYAKQRRDALSDWTMQNEYNSPEQQMKRFKMAGLNPNLIYGRGSSGDAGVVRSSQQPAVEFKQPSFGNSNPLDAYFNAQMKQAQIDNLRTQNTVAVQEQMLKAAQVASINIATDRNKLQLANDPKNIELSNSLKQISGDVGINQISQMMNKYTLDQQQIDIVNRSKESTIQKAAEELLNMESTRATQQAQRDLIQQQIENLRKDATIKQLDIDLKRLGVQPGDELWQRILARLVNFQTKP